MNQDMKTLELAQVYEQQGYYREALAIYYYLDDGESSYEITQGIKRLTKKIEQSELKADTRKEQLKNKTISVLMEKWLELIILEMRLGTLKKIKKNYHKTKA